MRLSVVLLVTAIMAVLSSSAQASIIAYEGFDGGTIGSDVAGVGSATGTGFEDLTSATTNFRFDTRAGLSYLNLDVSGNSAGEIVAAGGTQNLQLELSTPINSGTIWSSYLMQVNGVNSWGQVSGMFSGSVGSGNSTGSVEEATLRATSSNWGVKGKAGLDSRTGPDSTPDTTGTFFVVNEYNLDTGTMTAYLNPTDLTDVIGTASHSITDSATSGSFSFTHFGFSLAGSAASTGFIDEVRIGDTLADVTPLTSTAVPEPTSLAILGMCGLGMLTRRRR